MHTEIISHVVRRGVQHLTAKQQYINQLEQDAELYENAGPEMEVNIWEVTPAVVTALLAVVIIWSIGYTLGQVVSSLTMIETPSRTAIIEAAPPAYTDEPDAPLEKEPVKTAVDADVEVTVIEHKPITAKVTSSIGLLHRVGGFRARWRGLGLSVLYHVLHGFVANMIAFLLGFGIVGQTFSYIFASVMLARVHMAWTHKMIANPTSQWWWRRLPARKQCKALLLPALVHASAQQVTIILPLGVASAFGMLNAQSNQISTPEGVKDCHKLAKLGVATLAVIITWAVTGLAVLLPASITRTRIEASLLPEGEETIVSFDKDAMIGELDLTTRGSCRALFAQTWKSVDRASRWRLIKLYAKMILAQITVAVVAVHLIVAELYVMGAERMRIFLKSAAAQLKLASIESQH